MEVIERSLQGNYREEHLFVLQQAIEAYDFYQKQISECDEAIKKLEILSLLKGPFLLKKSRRKLRKYEYSFDITSHLKQLIGIDLTTISGIDSSTSVKLVGEIEIDITKWGLSNNFAPGLDYALVLGFQEAVG